MHDHKKTTKNKLYTTFVSATTALMLMSLGWWCNPVLANTLSMPEYIWLSPIEIAKLPVTGKAWQRLEREANKPLTKPNLSNQNDRTNVLVLAKALYFSRTGRQLYRQQVISACMLAINSENKGTTLSFGRELLAYVISAQLVGLPSLQQRLFTLWLKQALSKELKGRTLRSTHQDRPNNWGTHAGASRAAVAIYLGDQQELMQTADVFRGWLGDTRYYNNFKYGEFAWQADPQKPVGINAKGASKLGHNIDGVLPEEQRRGGKFGWPPHRENYAYEALQGALALAVILHRAGYDVWDWSDQALLRAFTWLHQQAKFPARGDDTWQSHLVNHFYGSHFPAILPAEPGKNIAWTDWTHPPLTMTDPHTELKKAH